MSSSIADFNLDCVVTALFVYPVKGCAALAVDELTLDARGGAEGDRGWAIVDGQAEVTWPGAHPRLALVHPSPEGTRMRLAAEDVAPITTPGEDALAPCQVKIWNELTARHDAFEAVDAGDPVAAWLAAVVGARLRLVRLGEAARARENNNALHLVFMASVAAVDRHLASGGRAPADLRRYRPNIVLSGQAADDAIEFVEDSFAALAWHGGDRAWRLPITAPCIRCVVPNVDPSSAAVDDSVLHALERLSLGRHPGAPVRFGVYARGPAGARLRIGDTARPDFAF